MGLTDFKYKLPKNLIAKYPIDPRNSSRMMVVERETGLIYDRQFTDIIDMFQKGDCIVLNETKVYPARILGTKDNEKIDITLLRELKGAEEKLWEISVDKARKIRTGNKISFDGTKFLCEVIDNTISRGRTVRFICDTDVYRLIERKGRMVLPEYIEREAEDFDKYSYQTVFANKNKLSSIAPPTAGLHFTNDMLTELENRGIKIVKINLTIGQGVFNKIKVEDITRHPIHHEYFEVSLEAAETINRAIKIGRNVFAVGASVVRALESSVLTSGQVKPNKGWTDKFIYPQYNFKIANKLLTNFHLPASPQLLLTAAFADRELILKAYKRAIRDEYRFYAYGDAMLII